MPILHDLLDLVLPPSCLGCDRPIRPADPLRFACARCRARLRAVPPPLCPRCGAPRLATGRHHQDGCGECAGWPLELAGARSACVLAPPADRLVHQLKYRGWRALAPILAERMAPLTWPDRERHPPVFCVPVPTTAARRRSRGYNQAELLARAYADLTRIECAGHLQRGGGRGSQTTLQPLARRANVAGAFAVAEGAVRLSGAHVVLVDDVLTTGATAAECARVLAAAGACCIHLVTFARALDARRLSPT